MADKRRETVIASWIDSSTAAVNSTTWLPVTEIAAPSTLQLSQPSNTSMATQLSSSCPPVFNLGGEQNSGQPGRESSTVPDASVLQSASTNLTQSVNAAIILTPEHTVKEQFPNFRKSLRSLEEGKSKLDTLTPILQQPTKSIRPELYSTAEPVTGACSPGLLQVREASSATSCYPTQSTKSSTTPTLEPTFERIPGTMHITSLTDFWSEHAVIGIASQSKPSTGNVHHTYLCNSASPFALRTSQRQHQEDVYLGQRTRDYGTITLPSQPHISNIPACSYTTAGLIKVYTESPDVSSSAESSTPRLDKTASFSGDVQGASHSSIGLFAGNEFIIPVNTPSHYNAEAPSPSKESSLSTDDMEMFCQLVEETRISGKLNQEQSYRIISCTISKKPIVCPWICKRHV
ncbi:uncharacterized protein LOC135829843 [Sycon ciliatum]|uniref:uncharacterized protein LOC135829843 n=1 Tax=Sycon ciliatum TaxID=27933 RepID=UPI0031F6C57D